MKKQNGLSLVELMIAITLGLFVMGAIGAVFLLSSKTYRTQNSYARLQENARFALSKLERDTRMAGYRGCLGGPNVPPATSNYAPVSQSPTLKTVLVNPTAYGNNFALGIQGSEYTGGAWSPALDASISGAVPTPSPITNSDVITVRVANGASTQLSTLMTNSSVDIPIVNSLNFVSGSSALISDCKVSTVFQITAVTATTLSHTVSATSNTTTDLQRAFDTDATVTAISTITYYVGASSSGTGTSLWRLTVANGVALAPEEVVEGVDSMRVLYGEDTDLDFAPNGYVTASHVANMNNVVAINLSLLMSTIENNITVTTQNYIFNGSSHAAGDNRVRRQFNTTISLRNRTL